MDYTRLLCDAQLQPKVAKTLIGCLHDPAKVQHYHVYFEYICWKFAGSCKHPITVPVRAEC